MFTEPLAAKIIKGEKTATRRVMSDNPRSPWSSHRCLYEVGQTFTVNPGRGVKRVAECEVTAVYKQPLGQMTEYDARAEGFTDRYSFWVVWNDLHGAFDDQEVWVVEFKLTGARCGECDGTGQMRNEGRSLLRWHTMPCTGCFATGIDATQRGRDFVARVERELAEAAG